MVRTTGATYEAHAFHPTLGNEVAAGKISVDQWEFHFQSEAVSIDVPMPRLRARFGDGDDERLFFWDANTPEWEIYTTDETILNHPDVKSHSDVREQLTSVASTQELWRRIRILGYVVVACVAIIWIGQLAVSAMVRSLVAKVPPQMEQQIGAEALAEARTELAFLEDPARAAKLAELAAPLLNTLGNGNTKFKFYLVEEASPNAFALPGGYVVVTTGLLNMADRPEEVIGVIAHEVAHVTQKHHIRKSISAVGPFLIFEVFLGGGSQGLARVAGGASDLLIQQSFSQEYEMEADDVGWQSLVAAKIDPRGMNEMFLKLQSFERSQRTGFELPQAFQSHPALEKRIARLEKKWKKLPAKTQFQDLSGEMEALKLAAGKN